MATLGANTRRNNPHGTVWLHRHPDSWRGDAPRGRTTPNAVTGQVYRLTHLGTSRVGNPTFGITLWRPGVWDTPGNGVSELGVYRTVSDLGAAYGIENAPENGGIRVGTVVLLSLTGAGRVTDWDTMAPDAVAAEYPRGWESIQGNRLQLQRFYAGYGMWLEAENV